MPTNFPTSDDVFNVPSLPITTPLGSSGDSDRTHSENHQDLGDALEAMQAQQTVLIHSHDSLTHRHGVKLTQANTHQSVDTDSSTTAIHHTIGSGANQYASGTHTHPVVTTYPVGAFLFLTVSTNPSSLGVIGTWTSVGQRFLCASDGVLGFTAGDIGGSNSHSHSIDASTNTVAAHTHDLTSGTSGSGGGHGHSSGAVVSNGISHYHDLTGGSPPSSVVKTGTTSWINLSHSHTSSSTSASHDHSPSAITSVGDHTHVISPIATSSAGSHSHINSTPSTTNNLVPLFVVYMWKRTA